MNPYKSTESRYLVNEANKGLSRHNLEIMIEQLQNEVSHNYTLIKSLCVRIKDLENIIQEKIGFDVNYLVTKNAGTGSTV